jgi:hypothetical protein
MATASIWNVLSFPPPSPYKLSTITWLRKDYPFSLVDFRKGDWESPLSQKEEAEKYSRSEILRSAPTKELGRDNTKLKIVVHQQSAVLLES